MAHPTLITAAAAGLALLPALLAPLPARADVSLGILEVRAWAPATAASAAGVRQDDPFGDMSLAPMRLDATGHPFDPPLTSGSTAQMSFDRPASGDADYHSFAAAYAFSYTPEPFDKFGRTHFDLAGSLRILPSDLQRLFGLMPLVASVRLESTLSLHGRFVAEASAGSPDNVADTGVRIARRLDNHDVGGTATVHAEDGGDPVLTTSGFLDGDLQARRYGATELDTMFGSAMTAFGLSEARGASLLSNDLFTELITFAAGGDCALNPFCSIPYYEAPLLVSIETWGDAGLGQSTVAAADLRNTLNFSFTVLDANGQPTDIPVYLTLDGTAGSGGTGGTVDEPGSGGLAMASLLVLGWCARRRRPHAPGGRWTTPA